MAYSTQDIMIKIGYNFEKTDGKLKYYNYIDENCLIKITISKNVFGFYKIGIYFKTLYNNTEYQYEKYSWTNNQYFNSYMFDLFNFLTIYSYLLKKNYKLNIRELTPAKNQLYYLTFSTDSITFSFASIEKKLFQSTQKSENDYFENISIRVNDLINRPSFYKIILDYPVLKFVENISIQKSNLNLDNLNFLTNDIKEDDPILNYTDISIKLNLKNFLIKYSSIPIRYSKNFYAETDVLEILFLTNKVQSKENLVIFLFRKEAILTLKNPLVKTINDAIVLIKNHIYKKY